MDPQEEVLAACCNALDKAHSLLSDVVLLSADGPLPPQLIGLCRDWVEDEYNPGERRARPCKHVPMQNALDSGVSCIRCGVDMGEAN